MKMSKETFSGRPTQMTHKGGGDGGDMNTSIGLSMGFLLPFSKRNFNLLE